MRKLFPTLAAILFATLALKAVPAYPGLIKYRQPDGKEISIRLHGDEFYHYATTDKGQVVALDRDGFYRPSARPFRTESEFERTSIRARSGNGRLQSPVRRNIISEGKKKFLIILVDFPDLKFTTSNVNKSFSNLLNQVGYSKGGATGSVFDYYYENSSGQFEPEFVVAGPYTAEKNYAEYGRNTGAEVSDVDPQGAFYDACVKAAADGLDFSAFDNDLDGLVDNVYFFYAGYGEADSGKADTIWPHASAIHKYNFTSNGVRVWSYACSAELRGSTGAMTGIGTFCHEFGHVLGLPDLYDTDYEKNGTADEVYNFSLMSRGNYNNDGNSPPYLSFFERSMLDWLKLPGFAGEGGKSLAPVQDNDGMLTPSSADKEYFIYEYRNGEGWDSYIPYGPQGLLIYHLDQSKEHTVGQYSAYELWGINKINCYSSHPCYYLVAPVSNPQNLNDYTLPGPKGITNFSAPDWSKVSTGYTLDNIHPEGGRMVFDLNISKSKTINGRVSDSAGRPLEGVVVSAVQEVDAEQSSSSSGIRLRSLRDAEASATLKVTTGGDGRYSIYIEDAETTRFTLIYSKSRYVDHSESVVVPTAGITRNVVLYNVIEDTSSSLQKYGRPTTVMGFTSADSPYSATCGMYYSASELLPYAGYKLRDIKFQIDGSPAQVDVFVDFGATRVFTRKVDNHVSGALCTVDIRDAGILIPTDTDVIIGYAVKDIENTYFMSVDNQNNLPGGGYLRYGYFTEGSDNWRKYNNFSFIISAEVVSSVSPFSGMGIKVIANPAGAAGYAAGSVFTPTLLNPDAGGSADRIDWYLDGNPVSGDGFVLSGSGRHTLKAVLIYPDGTSEEIEQVILVK